MQITFLTSVVALLLAASSVDARPTLRSRVSLNSRADSTSYKCYDPTRTTAVSQSNEYKRCVAGALAAKNCCNLTPGTTSTACSTQYSKDVATCQSDSIECGSVVGYGGFQNGNDCCTAHYKSLIKPGRETGNTNCAAVVLQVKN